MRANIKTVRYILAAMFHLLAAQNTAPRAQSLLEAGRTALQAGDYEHAAGRAREAAAIYHEIKDAANEAIAINLAGRAELSRGDYSAALRSFEQALALDRKSGDAKNEINHLSNIGNVYFFQGRYLDALENYEQALRRVEETQSESWNTGRRQLVLTNLAILYEQLGQNQKSLDYYKQALAGAGMSPSEQAQLLSNAGTLYRRLGDPVKALETYRAAQKLLSRERLSDAAIHILQNAGIAYALDLRDLPRALQAFTEALRLAEATSNRREIVLACLYRGEALYRMERLPEASRDLTRALEGAREIGVTEEQWTALYGLGRVERRQGADARALRTFREAIGIVESVRARLEPSLKTEFLANKRDVYDAAIDLILQYPKRDPEQLFGLFEQARSRNLQDALRTGTGIPALRAVQSRLAAGALLIEYWTGADRVAALWATKDSSGVIARPLTAADLSMAGTLAATLSTVEDSSWRAPAEHLGALLLPEAPLGGSVKNLLVVPDGVLSAVPFELLASGPSAPLLIERFAVSYLPSAALLLRNQSSDPPLMPWRRRLIAFGDPIADAGSALPDDMRWSRLPESGRELRSIARVLPGLTRVHAAQDDRKRFLSSGESSGVPLLHFSTHAMADGADPSRSRILFTAEPGSNGSEYLFRGEIAALPLAGVDLVTLSACETESGKLARGEGVQSFSRAFLSAGARSTVTTLWRVADGPTADFMEIFYRHLGRGDSKAEALRAAKLSFLHSGSRLALPKYWGAFVLNGDGQLPIRPLLSWMWAAGPMLAILIFLFLLRRHRMVPGRAEAAGLGH